MRRAARKDRNHGEVVAVLVAHGCWVLDLSALGNGVPDVLAFSRRLGTWALLEIKDGTAVKSKRLLTEPEANWHESALAHGVPVFVVTNETEALGALGLVP